jgi:hypothetical protein
MSVFLLLLSACTAPEGPVTPSSAVTAAETAEPTQPPEEAPGPPTRSGALVMATEPNHLYIADPDNGAILLFHRHDGQEDEVDVGAEPTRLVRHGRRVWATLRGEGRLAELVEDGGTLQITRVIEVGAEPFDVVVSPDGRTLYVSLSMQDEVVALDAGTLDVLDRYAVEGEPRWLATARDPWTDEPQLLVVPARGARIEVITPATAGRAALDFPRARRSATGGCEDVLLVPRATGEVLWDDVEGVVWALGTYADTEMPATPAGIAGPPVRCPAETATPPSGAGYYGSASRDVIGRFNPVLVRFDQVLGGPGAAWLLNPTSNPASSPFETVARAAPVTLDLRVAGGTSQIVVGVEGDQQLLYFSSTNYRPSTRIVDFMVQHIDARPAPGGPASVRIASLSDVELYTPHTWSRLQRTFHLTEGSAPPLPASRSELPGAVYDGRWLFTTTNDPKISAPSSGVACASCHEDGRTDGLTWRFPDMDRQTPSLAGPVSQTAPLTWTADVPTVEEEARLTAELRMGGLGLDRGSATRIAAYVDWTRDVLLPRPTAAEQALVAQGRELFHRPEVGCATCHADARGTRAGPVALGRFAAIRVPALTGVAATAPYFHDGSAPTLRAVLERSRDGSMGDTSTLDEHELLALEAFLRSFGG